MRASLGVGSLAALVVIGGLGGCATQKPGPPPLLDLTAHHCAVAPDLAGATALTLSPKKDESQTITAITSTSPCLKGSAGLSLYAAYELPSTPTPYLVRVNSEPEGLTLLALRVLLYGPDGSLKREFSGKQILFRGSDLSVIFRSHDGERYLVVASDPAAVGRKLARVHDATYSGVVPVYGGTMLYYSGTDGIINNVLSENGRVTVSLRPLAAK